MNVTCTSPSCPQVLNSKCVFYESSALPTLGIVTNDTIEAALQKIEAIIAAGGGGGGGTVYTASNGITLTGSDFALGGTVSTTKTINVSSFNELRFQANSNQLLSVGAGQMVLGLSTGLRATFNAGGALTITDNRATKSGVVYAADYSAGYTDRSLVDRGFSNANYWKQSGTTSLPGGPTNTDILVQGDGLAEDKVTIWAHIGDVNNKAELVIGNLDDGLGGFIPQYKLSAYRTSTAYSSVFAQDENLFILSTDGVTTDSLTINPIGVAVSVGNTVSAGSVVSITGGFNPVSGTNSRTVLNVSATWNTTGTYSGTVRGIYYNPSISNLIGATHIALETTSGQIRFGAITQDDTKTRIAALDAATGQLFWRDVATIGGGGGITNSAAANELMKSDGTNAVPSGLFSTTAGDLTLGTGLIGTARTILAAGTAADVGVNITSKGTGNIVLTNGTSTATLSTNDFRIVLASMTFGIDGSVYGSNRTSAITNAVEAGFKITHLTSGTPATGIGVSLEFKVETSAGNIEIGSVIEAVTTDVTLASEDFDLIFKTMAAGAAAAERVRITSLGNVGIGTSSFGTSAAKVLAIGNGTVPGSSPADIIQIYAKDSSDGAANSTLALRLEQAVEAIGTFTASHKIKVWINEVEYWIQLDAVV